MPLFHIRGGTCYKCTEKEFGPDWIEKEKQPVSRTFRLVRAFFTGSARQQTDILDCWECQSCHELVPAGSWRTYQETGDIVVPTKRRGR